MLQWHTIFLTFFPAKSHADNIINDLYSVHSYFSIVSEIQQYHYYDLNSQSIKHRQNNIVV